jgi:hypothetical protein
VSRIAVQIDAALRDELLEVLGDAHELALQTGRPVLVADIVALRARLAEAPAPVVEAER